MCGGAGWDGPGDPAALRGLGGGLVDGFVDGFVDGLVGWNFPFG